MALARILVDGYSMLHGCPELAPGRPRHSAAAREELIHRLMQYHDATGTPVTVCFDGAGAPIGTPKAHSPSGVEILFSGPGKTADEIIERAACRLRPYGEVLVVTDDHAERDTVEAVGAMFSSCWNFMRTMETASDEMRGAVRHFNGRELKGFKNRSPVKGTKG
jgi:hypothetical protein